MTSTTFTVTLQLDEPTSCNLQPWSRFLIIVSGSSCVGKSITLSKTRELAFWDLMPLVMGISWNPFSPYCKVLWRHSVDVGRKVYKEINYVSFSPSDSDSTSSVKCPLPLPGLSGSRKLRWISS